MKVKVFGGLLAIALLLGGYTVIFATNGIKNNFNTFYAAKGIVTAGSAIDQCILCHATNNGPDIPSIENPPNPYGVELESNGLNFGAAESLDSDVDGFTNLMEITQRTFPGNTSSHPPSVGFLITKYYNDILDRGPETGGAESWTTEISRIVSLGIDIKEGFIALGKSFFNSAEYLAMGKTDTAYVTDLYQTFLNRNPAQFEIDAWLNYLSQGVSRNEVLNFFVFSPEFKSYMEGIFGVGTTDPENNLVNDFYRGILSRLPDTAGYNSWLVQMRAAQCSGSAQQVRDLSYQIASLFVSSPEYTARARTDRGYVEDLYDAILRRGAAPWELDYWLNYLTTSTRDQALQGFTNSTEFQTRVQAVIDAGCL